MANDPLALDEFLSGAPDEADYDAAYAAVMATERGRWFLSQFANRNRQADTRMLMDTIARLEAAIRGEKPPEAVAPSRDTLREIAAALDSIAAEISASAARTPAGFAALERIQDIAFEAREREVETTLCDALDGAVREVSVAWAVDEASAQRAQWAAGQLRDLAARIAAEPGTTAFEFEQPRGEGAAALASDHKAEDAPEEDAFGRDARDSDTPDSDRVAAEASEDESFAVAVAALAGSLPAPLEAAEAQSPPAGHGDPAGSGPDFDEPPVDQPRVEPSVELAALQFEPSSAESPSVEQASSEAWLSREPYPFEVPPADSVPEEPGPAEPSPLLEGKDGPMHSAVADGLSAGSTLDDPAASAGDGSAAQFAWAPVPEPDDMPAPPEAAAARREGSADVTEVIKAASELVRETQSAGEGSASEELPSEPSASEGSPGGDSIDDDATMAAETIREFAVASRPNDATASAGEFANAENSHFADTVIAAPAALIDSSAEAALGPDGREDRNADAPQHGEPVVIGEAAEQSLSSASRFETLLGEQAASVPAEAEAPAGPEEDPADLFDPLPPPSFSPVVDSEVPAAAHYAAPSANEITPDIVLSLETRRDESAAAQFAPSSAPDAPVDRPEPDQIQQIKAAPAASGSGMTRMPGTQAPSAVSVDDQMAGSSAEVPPQRLTATARPYQRPAPSDPLAAIRALSEEERIALFS